MAEAGRGRERGRRKGGVAVTVGESWKPGLENHGRPGLEPRCVNWELHLPAGTKA